MVTGLTFQWIDSSSLERGSHLRRFAFAMFIGMITEAVAAGVLISYIGVSQRLSISIGIVMGLAAVAAVFRATGSREGR